VFIGHFALGYAAKPTAPRLSLAVLFAAAQLADILWPILIGLGIEQVRIDPGNTAMTPLDFVSYPYSHSLLSLSLLGIALGWLVSRRHHRRRTFVIVAALVASHWFLDVATHRRDMPLYPGSAKYGLGLWNHVPLTIAIESLMFIAGVFVYLRTTYAKDAVGRWAGLMLPIVLALLYVANIGAAPPSVTTLWISAAIGAAAICLLAWWADRHRAPHRAQ
jgi:hypothetical protein